MPAPIDVVSTEIPDVKVVRTSKFSDDRGFFTEAYSRTAWRAAGFSQDFVQDNLSYSRKGTLRGLHYQIDPAAMGKLVRCLRGAVYDVAVDLRRGSPTFGQHVARELSEENGLALWVPRGFAHGFVALENDSLVFYKCDGEHSPAHERAVSYCCPKLGIGWPLEPTIISAKDAAAPGLDDADYNFTWTEGV